ncbi:MAG: type II toxin-antitoxin system HicA family toxin [bacterium]
MRITPIHYRKLTRVFEKQGFVLARRRGDHLYYVKTGIKRPIVIPAIKDIPVFIIENNLKTAGISRNDYFKLLQKM